MDALVAIDVGITLGIVAMLMLFEGIASAL